MFRKAERKRTYLKIGFSAPSGAGKTYSALLSAYGLCGDWSKIAVIDTENGSAELYSNLGDYSVCPIEPPFTPKKYMTAIKEAESLGFSVLIIDSLSHAWSGEGGLLDMQDKAVKASKSGNSYTAWREITPEHNRLVDSILQCNMDVIVTTRAKSEYVISTDDKGKKDIKKIGLAPVFREGLEYELTTFFDLTQDHIATASKDRTGIFDGQNFIPTEETGKAFAAWRDGGSECVDKTQKESNKTPQGVNNKAQNDSDQSAATLSQRIQDELEKSRNTEITIKGTVYRLGDLSVNQLEWLIGRAQGDVLTAAQVVKKEKLKAEIDSDEELPFN